MTICLTGWTAEPVVCGYLYSSDIFVESSPGKMPKNMVKKACFFQRANVPEKEKDDISTQIDTVILVSSSAAAFVMGKRFMKSTISIPCSFIIFKERFTASPIPSKFLLCKAAVWLLETALQIYTVHIWHVGGGDWGDSGGQYFRSM